MVLSARAQNRHTSSREHEGSVGKQPLGKVLTTTAGGWEMAEAESIPTGRDSICEENPPV